MSLDIGESSKNLIEGFINEHVTRQGLDSRTEKAYRLDLKLFYLWLDQKEAEPGKGLETAGWETRMKDYLDYLTMEKKLSASTISRKNKVIRYYLSYLSKRGMIPGYYSPARGYRKKTAEKGKRENGLLSRKEADAFFEGMTREYEELESEFRKRICLRDMVMMGLLFYHKIEISELLRIQVEDYDAGSGTLRIRKKREGESGVYLYSRELRQKLEKWLEEREYLKRDGEYEDIMFLSKLGKPLSMEMMVRIFDKYRELAGIERKFTPRDLKEGVMKEYARELVMERYGR